MSDVADRVKKIVIEHLNVEAEKVTENASFIDDLGADSLDTVELVMAFEEEFNVEIPDDAAESIVTVGDAVKFIKGKSEALSAHSKRDIQSPDAPRRRNRTWLGDTARMRCRRDVVSPSEGRIRGSQDHDV